MSADGCFHPDRLRLDKFLWFARFARTRSAAARLCLDGRVKIGGVAATKPHQPVRIGDWLTVDYGAVTRRVRIRALGERRGDGVMARRLYDEPAPPLRVEIAEWEPLLEDA